MLLDLRNYTLINQLKDFDNLLDNNDLKNKILTVLIWINMSPYTNILLMNFF